MRTSKPLALPALLALLVPMAVGAQPVDVVPTSETQPGVLASGNQEADVAIWVHPKDPSRSLLLVADVFSGLVTFTLEGSEFQLIAEGVVSGVDVQAGVSINGTSQQLVAVANRTLNGLVFYVVDPGTLAVSRVDPTDVVRVTNFAPVTVTLYRSPTTGKLFAFTGNDVAGNPAVVQIELQATPDGGVTSTPVRTITLGSPAAGLVADDEQGLLFIAERDTGLSRIDAEPGATTTPTPIASVTPGVFPAPVGGVTIYRGAGTEGYLLAASTGGDSFAVFGRRSPFSLLGTFRVVATNTIDVDNSPRSLDVTAQPLGPRFPRGLFLAHDSIHDPVQNYKMVPWPNVANAFTPPLIIAAGDGGTDGGTPDGGGADGGRPDGGGNGLPGGPSGPTLPPDDPSNGSCSCGVASVPGLALLALMGLGWRGRRRRG
ncbi:phytase [Myxococcaceae bacterium GXIMD 01537]